MTRQIKFSINPDLLAKFPGFRWAVVVATGIDNTQASPLKDDVTRATSGIKDGVILDDQRIVAWREAFALLGIKPRDFRPSVDALVRRILNDKPFGSVNPLVDLGTVISLEFVLPAGAHPILADTTEVALTIAKGTEIELGDNGHPAEHVPAGEPILADTGRVATRRWVWRQTAQSRIAASTQDFYLNIDALDCIDDDTLQAAIVRAQGIIKQELGKDSQVVTLSSNNPAQTIEIN